MSGFTEFGIQPALVYHHKSDYLGINKFFNIIDRKKDIDNMMFSNKESNGK